MKAKGLSLDQAPPQDIPLRFFVSAPLFGVMAGGLVLLRGNLIFQTTWHPETLALAHLITLGWLAMVMIGAFYQMIPVLVGGHVLFLPLARWVHAGMFLGVLGFVGGILNGFHPIFFIASVLLVLAFGIFIVQLTLALFRVKANRPTVLAMRVSILSLLVMVILGGALAGQLAGWWSLPFSRTALKNVHLTLGLLGWIACLILGVGFHVIPMFYLAHPFPQKPAWYSLILLMITLVFLPMVFLLWLSVFWKIVATLPAMAGGVYFIKTLWDLFRQRKRKVVDTTLRYWQLGLLALLLSCPFLLVSFWFPTEGWDLMFAILFLMGFAVSVTNGMLYKIIPFLIWLHRFSSLVGKVKVPLMADLVSDTAARKQWQLSVAALVALILGIAEYGDIMIRLGGGLWAVSSGMLFFNLYKALRVMPPSIPEQSRGSKAL